MTSLLMQRLQFTEADVAYNRRGELSPQQSARLTARRRSFKTLLLILGVLLACAGGGTLAALGISSLAQNDSVGVGMLVGAGIFVLFGAPLIFLGLKPMQRVKVAAITGPARVARVQRSRRVNNTTSTYIATEMHLGGKIFRLPDETFPELEDGADYTVYYWDGLNEVFSLEKR